MTTTIDQRHRAVIKNFAPGDVVQVEPQSDDVVILRRIKPAPSPKPRLVRINGELFSAGGRPVTSEDVREIIEEAD